jgi:hypothetical protein
MQFKTLVALLFGINALTSFESSTSLIQGVSAEQVQPPLKLRFNTNLWKKVFKMRDQEVLAIFRNIQIGDSNDT